jgi:membrane protease YdiL (CAAX protease family)
MTIDTARELIAVGFFMMLLMLRLEAERFGTAEYDEPGRRRADAASWLAWYLMGAAFLAALYVVHPRPHDQLYLLIGRRLDVIVFGLPLAILGALQAAAYARYRYGYLRLPALHAYPRAVVNSIGTSLIDEAMFRGAILGTLIAIGCASGYAILISTVCDLLATRLLAPGRSRYMLVPALGYGLLGGWATLATGGIGAAIAFHAVTSFALFVCTGHSGQPALAGREPEELLAVRRAPAGWQDALRPTVPGRGAEPRGLAFARPEPLRGEETGPAASRGMRWAAPARTDATWSRVRQTAGRMMSVPRQYAASLRRH